MNLKKPTGVILLLIWSLFMGVTAISIGFGAAIPALNQIAAPVVCPNGRMSADSTTYRPMPGTTVTTVDWMCIDGKTGKAQPVNEAAMFIFNGLIYGTLLFLVIVLVYWLMMKRNAQRAALQAANVVSTTHTSSIHTAPTHATVGTSNKTYELERDLAQLKKLRDEDLITEQDYEQKKMEILSRI